MPIIKSAIKRARQALKRKSRNQELKLSLRQSLKRFADQPGSKQLSEAHSKIDTALKKGLLKPATAARRKSKLAKQLKTAASPRPAVKAKRPQKATAAASPKMKPAAKKAAAPKTRTAKKTAAK